MEKEGGSHIFSMAPCPHAVTPPAFPCSPHPASFPTCFPPPAPVRDLLFPPSFPRQPEPVSVSHQGFIFANPAPSACSCTLMGPEMLLTPSDLDLPYPNFHQGQAHGSVLCWKGAFICPSHTWIPWGLEKPHPAVGAATWPCSCDKMHPAWSWSERVTGPLNAGLLSPCPPCTSYRAA